VNMAILLGTSETGNSQGNKRSDSESRAGEDDRGVIATGDPGMLSPRG